LKLEVALVLPAGWRVEPAVARFEVPANGRAKADYQLAVPAAWTGTSTRTAIAADVLADGKYLGEIAEAVVDLHPDRKWH
jgi:hypothetical protein